MIYKNDLMKLCRELLKATQAILEMPTDGQGRVDTYHPAFDDLVKASEHARKRLEREDDPDGA